MLHACPISTRLGSAAVLVGLQHEACLRVLAATICSEVVDDGLGRLASKRGGHQYDPALELRSCQHQRLCIRL